jgi:hypothetical protein
MSAHANKRLVSSRVSIARRMLPPSCLPKRTTLVGTLERLGRTIRSRFQCSYGREQAASRKGLEGLVGPIPAAGLRTG